MTLAPSPPSRLERGSITGSSSGAETAGSLSNFVARLLGWTNEPAITLALHSIDLARECRAALVLCGDGDLVPIARALHRRALGAERPFVVCDPRRGDAPASVRSPACYRGGEAAISAALGGSLCMRAHRAPRDLAAMLSRLRTAADVAVVVCADTADEANPLLARPAPIRLPSLTARM